MWPRLLFDLLPHFARLVPVADKFLATRSASERAQETALAAMSTDVRDGLGEVGEMHSGIQRALKEQGEQVAQIAVEVTRTRMGTESVETRVAALEKTAGTAIKLLVVGIVLLVAVVGLLVVVLLHLAGR